MKASVKPKQLRYVEKCEVCGSDARIIAPPVEEGKKQYVTYRCANAHEFVRTVDVK